MAATGSFNPLDCSLNSFDSVNSGLLVSCSESQFAENFLNSSEANSGL